MLRAAAQPFNLLGCELTHHLGWASQNHGAIRKLLALGDQRARAHQAVLADLGAVEHHSANADQRFVADGAAVQHDLVAHRHDKQKVIDALVNEVKTRSAQAVKDGKITQAQADEHVKSATERITKMVDEGFPKGGPRGDHPEPPADDDGGN